MSPFNLSALMAFYSPDGSMDQRLEALVQRLAGERGEALASGLSITWLRYGESLLAQGHERHGPDDPRGAAASEAVRPGCGASWQGGRLQDPGDLVQLPYLIAIERWVQKGLLEDEPELNRALLAMIRQGSHDATSYVVDRLSGTTSGPVLAESGREVWMAQRRLVNGWLASLGWPELEGCQAAQKTWQDGPYGRERQFLGPERENANRFSSDGLARLGEAVLAGTLISPPACQRMRSLLAVTAPEGIEAAEPLAALAAQLSQAGDGGRRIWGKAGHGANSLQLLLYAEGAGQVPTLLVVLGEPGADLGSEGLLGEIVADLFGTEAIAA
jgi:hypothetical protein